MLAKSGNLVRPDIRCHDIGIFRIARDLAADMPELLQVRMLRILGRLDAERRVAARATGAGLVILALDLGRQREEALENIVGGVDAGLRYAVATDAAETNSR